MTTTTQRFPSLLVFGFLVFFSILSAPAAEVRQRGIELSEDGSTFVYSGTSERFQPWGVNYDHNAHTGELIEDYWTDQWELVEEDFNEIKTLGANTVRVHLQLGRFMKTPTEADPANLAQLTKLLALAEGLGLYLDLTGLGCYHKQDVPEWYDELSEVDRWAVQARFWEAVSGACKDSPAVFCYDLMNEPILPGQDKVETEWLGGELGGKYFVQRLSLDLAGRTREEVAKAWIDTMISAIRKHDDQHLVTVGVIPWAQVWPQVKPFFYSKEVGADLDFVSVHFYPKKGEVEAALTALAKYDIGKPLVVEETFPLSCSADELEQFIRAGSKDHVDGWISFYWGKTVEEYGKTAEAGGDGAIAAAMVKDWLERFQKLSKRTK